MPETKYGYLIITRLIQSVLVTVRRACWGPNGRFSGSITLTIGSQFCVHTYRLLCTAASQLCRGNNPALHLQPVKT